MSRLRVLAAAAVTGASLLLVAGPAVAQSEPCGVPGYPPCVDTTPTAVVSDPTPLAGETIIITAEDGTYAPFENVNISLVGTGSGGAPRLVLGRPQAGGIFLGTATANARGGLRAEVTIPAGVDPGAYVLQAVGTTSGAVVTVPIAVVGQATGGTGGTGADGGSGLPLTGKSSTIPLAATGAAMVVVGAATIVVARRTRTASATV